MKNFFIALCALVCVCLISCDDAFQEENPEIGVSLSESGSFLQEKGYFNYETNVGVTYPAVITTFKVHVENYSHDTLNFPKIALAIDGYEKVALTVMEALPYQKQYYSYYGTWLNEFHEKARKISFSTNFVDYNDGVYPKGEKKRYILPLSSFDFKFSTYVEEKKQFKPQVTLVEMTKSNGRKYTFSFTLSK